MKKTFREKMMLVCAVILVLAFGSIVIRSTARAVLVRKLHQDNALTRILFQDNDDLLDVDFRQVDIDWAEKYPFRDDSIRDRRKKSDSLPEKIKKAEFKIHRAESRLDEWTNKRFFNYIHLVELMNYYKKVIGWDIDIRGGYNSVIELEDGRFVEFADKVDMDWEISSLTDFSSYCREHKINFILALAPGKIGPAESEYAGKLDFSNDNADRLLQGLKENHVEYVDLRQVPEMKGQSHKDFFFITDHHWKPFTARAAAAYTLSYLNQNHQYTADVSLLAPDRFEEKVYPKEFLGSHGKKVTLARAKPEDFPLYYPKYAASFSLKIPDIGLDQSGYFSIFYDMTQFERKRDYYGRNAHSAYTYGDHSLIQIRNSKKQDGKKVLLLHDSFGDEFTPFFSLGLENLDTLDPRRFNGSIKTFMEMEKPDTVIILFYISEIKANKSDSKYRRFFEIS